MNKYKVQSVDELELVETITADSFRYNHDALEFLLAGEIVAQFPSTKFYVVKESAQ